jgi:hypothetical protein
VVNFGGGAEYFLTRHDTILGEATSASFLGATSLNLDYETGY